MSDESYLTPHTALHIDGLPVETLSRIFLLISRDIRLTYHPHPSTIANSLYQRTIQPPLRISHVSRRWREISLSIGELWSRFYINLSMQTVSAFSRSAIEVFGTFLERTGGSPLNCWFYCNINPGANLEVHPAGEYIITTLLKEQRRWKDVHFRWLSLSLSDGFQGIKVSDTPLLTSLFLETGLTTARDTKKVVAQVDISKASQLRDLYLRECFSLEIGEKPLPTLRACTLRFGPLNTVTTSTCMNVLSGAPNLRKFAVRSFTLKGLATGVRDSVICLDLEDLVFVSSDSKSIILDRLHLPKLVRLVYVDTRGSSMGTLLKFIQRSRPPLKYLMVNSGADENTVIQMLSLLPTLVRLGLNRCHISARLFQALDPRQMMISSVTAKQEVLCPRLRTILLGWFAVEGDFDSFMDALYSTMESLQDDPRSYQTVRFRNSAPSDLILDGFGRAAIREEVVRERWSRRISFGETSDDALEQFRWQDI